MTAPNSFEYNYQYVPFPLIFLSDQTKMDAPLIQNNFQHYKRTHWLPHLDFQNLYYFLFSSPPEIIDSDRQKKFRAITIEKQEICFFLKKIS